MNSINIPASNLTLEIKKVRRVRVASYEKKNRIGDCKLFESGQVHRRTPVCCAQRAIYTMIRIEFCDELWIHEHFISYGLLVSAPVSTLRHGTHVLSRKDDIV